MIFFNEMNSLFFCFLLSFFFEQNYSSMKKSILSAFVFSLITSLGYSQCAIYELTQISNNRVSLSTFDVTTGQSTLVDTVPGLYSFRSDFVGGYDVHTEKIILSGYTTNGNSKIFQIDVNDASIDTVDNDSGIYGASFVSGNDSLFSIQLKSVGGVNLGTYFSQQNIVLERGNVSYISEANGSYHPSYDVKNGRFVFLGYTDNGTKIVSVSEVDAATDTFSLPSTTFGYNFIYGNDTLYALSNNKSGSVSLLSINSITGEESLKYVFANISEVRGDYQPTFDEANNKLIFQAYEVDGYKTIVLNPSTGDYSSYPILDGQSGSTFISQICLNTSLDVNLNEPKLSFYPNPVMDILSISDVVAWKLYTIEGKLVKHETSAIVKMNELKPGTYFLKVGNEINKLIKL